MAACTVQQAFEIAVQHQQSGRLAEAEAIYRQILDVEPRNADALHLLGIIAHQVGRNDMAVELIHQAIAANPSVADFHCNLGIVLDVHGRSDEAIAAFRRAIELQPDCPESHNNLGNALRNQSELDEAIGAFRKAIQLRRDFAEAYTNLGTALRDKGELDEAIVCYRQAIALKPDHPEAHCNLGIALKAMGQLDEATAAYRQAIALKANYHEAHNNLGNALKATGRPDAAIAAFRQAIAIQPNFPEAYSNLGGALSDKGAVNEAIDAFRQAIALKPSFPEAHYNLGNTLKDTWQLDEAIAAYRQAIALRPDYPEAHSNLGGVLKDEGQLDEAIAAYRHATALNPECPKIHSNLAYGLHFHSGSDGRAIAREHRQWNRKFVEPLQKLLRPHSNDRDPKRRLRVGYVSPDFRDHVVGRNILPILERHDRSHVEVFCYANVSKPDAITLRCQQTSDVWRNIATTSDQDVADLIRSDRIDILVDLTLHMENNRLLVFAHKPAPVQATWAGYPGSTGLATMDYRLTDPYLDPPGLFDADYSEESIRLPESFWCYDPLNGDVPVNPLPALTSGHITFGSLNNYCKVNEGVIELWSKVLCAVNDSCLLLLSKPGSHRQRALELFHRSGVAADRIEWFTPAPRQEYLAAHHRIDLGLDTFPYNGHTTSLDSFWMGVPVVTLIGSTVVGRGGLSQATNLGLPQLVAQTPEDYVKRALNLVADLPRLAELRQTLRHRMQTSPLMDASRFTRNLEQAYRAMWRRWCEP